MLLFISGFGFQMQEKILPTNLQIKNGYAFGMCTGYCLTEIEITSQKIKMIEKGSKKNGEKTIKLPNKTCERIVTKQEWSALLKAYSLESKKFQKLKERIGCPDCNDGGKEWIEIIDKKTTKKVIFEFDKKIPEINNMLIEIRKIRKSLNDCKK